jgi:hypothetical protein
MRIRDFSEQVRYPTVLHRSHADTNENFHYTIVHEEGRGERLKLKLMRKREEKPVARLT